MFQLLGVEVHKAQLSFDTTVISSVQKVGSIGPLETRIYALWSLHIEGGNILYNSVSLNKITLFYLYVILKGITSALLHAEQQH